MECEGYLSTPLTALRAKSKSLLSKNLNATKVIPSPSGHPRDWRGLADIVGSTLGAHSASVDPTASVLAFWQRNQKTIGQLIEALKEIDRWDVVDDSLELLKSDAEFHTERLQGGGYPLVEGDRIDNLILTIDDVNCIESCGKPQNYDAFLLYDENDEEFAMNILETLENEYQLKLCTKNRDLIGGVSFEHEAIMQLIEHRCGCLIVVVSPFFLNNPAYQFLLTFAQALGIEKRRRKIIPCVNGRIELPIQLRYYFILNFSRSTNQWSFWKQLSQSVKSTSMRMITAGEDSKFRAICDNKVKITEMTAENKETDIKDVDIYEPLKEKTEVDSAYLPGNELATVEIGAVAMEPNTKQMSRQRQKTSVSSTSIFTKIFSSHTPWTKKKKKLVKVLAE